MKYTERDIEKAIRLKSEGYNWIAKNKAGRPFAFGRIPYRYADDSNEYNIWDNQPGTPWLMLPKDEFTSITWENEPVYIDEIITGVKVQDDKDKEIARLTAENKAYADNILRAIKILQNSDGFKAQTAINQAIGVLLGNKDNKCKREID